MEPHESPAETPHTRKSFLLWGVALEGGLILVAWGIEWLFPGKPALPTVRQQLQDFPVGAVLGGIIAGVGMVPLAMGIERSRWSEFRRITQILRDLLGGILPLMTWWELLLIGGLAGLGEEVLFRGVLEPRVGWIGSNVLFGLLHPITVVYVLLVIIAGMVFSGLKWCLGSLWGPILAHGLYDFVLLVILARRYRAEREWTGWKPPIEGNSEGASC
ncbi:MAG: CPBP family intramembrane glutamic endopeptidase [Planctomycetales bacterium]